MKGGKLFILLKALSRQEFKDLKKVVCSPIYNTNERMLFLYEALKPLYPNFGYVQKEKERLFETVFPGEPFNNYKIHRLFTQMTQVVEEYLLLIELRKNKTHRQKNLLSIYKQRNLNAFFEKECRDLSKKLEKAPSRDMRYYETQVYLNNAIYFHPLHNKYDPKDKSLDRLMEALDQYFMLAKMRYGISLKNRERILAKPGDWRFMEVLEEETSRELMQDNILFQLYHQAFLLLEEKETLDFLAYEQLLFEHINHIQEDAKILFFTGLNYINRHVNQGTSGFSRKAFDWYRLGLEKGLLIDNGKLNEVTFGNIVTFGCREKEFAWTKAFMNDFGPFLEPEKREEILTYHYALWHFYQKRFDQTYSLITNYTFPDVYFLKSRLLAIRAILEIFLQDDEYYALLNYQIKAFKQGMKRNKVFSKTSMEPVLNSVNLIGLFAKKIYEFEERKTIKSALKTKLSAMDKVAGKDWLLEKINAL